MMEDSPRVHRTETFLWVVGTISTQYHCRGMVPLHAVEIWLWTLSLLPHFDQSSDGLMSLGSV